MTVSTCTVSRLRHSLLQPTSAIGLILKTASDDKLATGSVMKTLEVAARATQELHIELEALMDFLVLEYGKTELVISSVNLHDAITEAVSEDPVLIKSIQRLHIADSQTITIETDRNLLLKSIRALIKNALEFSDGPVEVSLQKNDHDTEILIEDDGIGIHETVVKRLGEPFLVANAVKTKRTSRMGVGLPTAKKAAESLGGMLDVRPRTGGGTAALLTLPLLG